AFVLVPEQPATPYSSVDDQRQHLVRLLARDDDQLALVLDDQRLHLMRLRRPEDMAEAQLLLVRAGGLGKDQHAVTRPGGAQRILDIVWDRARDVDALDTGAH